MRHRLVRTLIGAAALLLPAIAMAQSTDWPTKPVRVVTPSNAGITDTHSRIVFEALSDRLGQRFSWVIAI